MNVEFNFKFKFLSCKNNELKKGTPCQNFTAFFYLNSHVTGISNGECQSGGCGE